MKTRKNTDTKLLTAKSMAMARRINRRGFYPLFTTLGLVLVIMVVAIVIQWNSGEAKAYDAHTDRLSWLRINNAVGNVKTMIASSLRDLFYGAVMKTGKISPGETINKYLNSSKEGGWNQIVSDIRIAVSQGFNDAIPNIADYSNGHQSTFAFEEGINITIGELTGDNLDITETKDGVVGIVQLPIAVTNRYQGWEATLFEANITIPLNMRLKDMYGRGMGL